MECIRVINEATAACIGHDLAQLDPENEVYYLVIDISADKMTVTLMLVEEGIYEVREAETVENIGGNTIDTNLAEYCSKQFEKSTGITIS